MNSKELSIVQDLTKFQTPTFPGQRSIDPSIILKEGPELIKRIKKKNPKQCSDQFKIQCVQFFIQYYTTRMFLLAPLPTEDQLEKIQTNVITGPPKYPKVDEKKLQKFKNDQIVDMEFAWKLLNTDFKSEQLKIASTMFKIEIGQRLESSIKLANALDCIPLSTHDIQIQMVVFTAAPLIGRWKQFIDIGKVLPTQAFEQFSQVSQNMPVPDYSILFEIAKEERAQEFLVPNPNELPWIQLNVSKIRIKFRNLNCEEFIDKQKELLNEIQQNEENTFWEEVPNPNNVHLRRMGAIYQCVSFSETPQQLCGIFDESYINVKGKTQAIMESSNVNSDLKMNSQIQSNSPDAQISVQEEMWNLKQDIKKKNLFKGVYKLHNYTREKLKKKILDPEKAPLHMEFDLELILCTTDEFLKIKEQEENNLKKIITNFDELTLD